MVVEFLISLSGVDPEIQDNTHDSIDHGMTSCCSFDIIYVE